MHILYHGNGMAVRCVREIVVKPPGWHFYAETKNTIIIIIITVLEKSKTNIVKTWPRPWNRVEDTYFWNRRTTRTWTNVPKRPTFGLALRSSESVAGYFRFAKKNHAYAHGKRFSDGTHFVPVLCSIWALWDSTGHCFLLIMVGQCLGTYRKNESYVLSKYNFQTFFPYNTAVFAEL